MGTMASGLAGQAREIAGITGQVQGLGQTFDDTGRKAEGYTQRMQGVAQARAQVADILQRAPDMPLGQLGVELAGVRNLPQNEQQRVHQLAQRAMEEQRKLFVVDAHGREIPMAASATKAGRNIVGDLWNLGGQMGQADTASPPGARATDAIPEVDEAGGFVGQILQAYAARGGGSVQALLGGSPIGQTVAGQVVRRLYNPGWDPKNPVGMKPMGGVFGGLTKFGLGAAGIGAAAGAYQLWETGAQRAQQLSAMTGGTSMGEMVDLELSARMTAAFSPFLNTAQMREIQNATFRAGYGGRQADNIMDYLAANVSEGILNIEQSLDLYRDVVDRAGGSTQAITGAMNFLKETARETGLNLTAAAANFAQRTSQLTAMGLSGNAAAGAAAMSVATFANADNPALRAWGGPNMNSPIFQAYLAEQLGTDPAMLKNALWRLPEGAEGAMALTGASGTALRRTLRDFGLRPGMSEAQINNTIPGDVLINFLNEAGFSVPPDPETGEPDYAAALEMTSAFLSGENPMDPERLAREHYKKQYAATKATDAEIDRLHDQDWAVGIGSGQRSEQGMRDIYFDWAHRNDQRLQGFERFLDMEGRNFGDYAVRTKGGKLVNLGDWLQQDEGNVRRFGEGQVRVAHLSAKERELLGDKTGGQLKDQFKYLPEVIGDPFGEAVSTAAGAGGMITLSDEARQYFRFLKQTGGDPDAVAAHFGRLDSDG
jgi:hypothetical protein